MRQFRFLVLATAIVVGACAPAAQDVVSGENEAAPAEAPIENDDPTSSTTSAPPGSSTTASPTSSTSTTTEPPSAPVSTSTSTTTGSGPAASDPCNRYADLLYAPEAVGGPTEYPEWGAALRDALGQLDARLLAPWDYVVSVSDSEGSELPPEEFIRHFNTLDDLTYEQCGLPMISAMAQVDPFDACTTTGLELGPGEEAAVPPCERSRPTTWPCFEPGDPELGPFGPFDVLDGLGFYLAVDCVSGQPLAIDPGTGDWAPVEPTLRNDSPFDPAYDSDDDW